MMKSSSPEKIKIKIKIKMFVSYIMYFYCFYIKKSKTHCS
jgi:hypothetical protein